MIHLLRNRSGISDGKAIGTPAGVIVGPLPIGQLAHVASGSGGDDIDVAVFGFARVFGSVADKSDGRTVGTPDGRFFVVVATGQGVEFLCIIWVEEVQVRVNFLIAI